jgi:Putative Flp pilus-assembly TadE/G-like
MNKNEKGQALILMALAFVGMLGFVALALDGGMIYSDRRFAQNGADAASLAGGGAGALSMENSHVLYDDFSCSDSRVLAAISAAKTAAIDRAADNTFAINTDIDNPNHVEVDCGITHEWFGKDKHIDIKVDITKNTDSIFAHFVYKGPLRNSVEAVTRIRPRSPMAFGNAIVALNDAGCSGNSNGVIFGGSSGMTINGGGVFSNGCLKGNGGKFSATVNDGNVSYVKEEAGTLSGISPDPQQVPSILPNSSYEMRTPDCSQVPNRSQNSDTLSPGVYNKITLTNGDLTMKPGLYCLTSSNTAFKILGGSLTGENVTIYVLNGDVSISGNAEVSLSAPLDSPDPSPAIPGMLIQLAKGNTNTVDVQGTSASTFVGTIYAPDGDIVLEGTGDSGSGGEDVTKFHTQLIGQNVTVTGNAELDINFKASENATIPAKLELYK